MEALRRVDSGNFIDDSNVLERLRSAFELRRTQRQRPAGVDMSEQSKLLKQRRNKRLPFNIHLPDTTSSYQKSMTINHFKGFTIDKKVLLAVGNANEDRYSFLQGFEEKAGFIFTIVNKGLVDEDWVTPEELVGHIREAVDEGTVALTGEGPQLTIAGLKVVQTIKATPGRS